MSKYQVSDMVAKFHSLEAMERELEEKLRKCKQAKLTVRTMVISALPAERQKPGENQAKYVRYLEQVFINFEAKK